MGFLERFKKPAQEEIKQAPKIENVTESESVAGLEAGVIGAMKEQGVEIDAKELREELEILDTDSESLKSYEELLQTQETLETGYGNAKTEIKKNLKARELFQKLKTAVAVAGTFAITQAPAFAQSVSEPEGNDMLSFLYKKGLTMAALAGIFSIANYIYALINAGNPALQAGARDMGARSGRVAGIIAVVALACGGWNEGVKSWKVSVGGEWATKKAMEQKIDRLGIQTEMHGAEWESTENVAQQGVIRDEIDNTKEIIKTNISDVNLPEEKKSKLEGLLIELEQAREIALKYSEQGKLYEAEKILHDVETELKSMEITTP